MPLRKNRTFTTTALTVCCAATLALPGTASAFSWRDFFSQARQRTQQTVETTQQTTEQVAEQSTDTAGGAVEQTEDTAGEVVDGATNTAAQDVAPAKRGACQPLPTTQAFAKFGDNADYYSVPGGDFENGAPGWTLRRGARVTLGNESLGVQDGRYSLDLPVGATATSPEFCVDETQPTFRFAAKLSALDAGYAAIVLYRDTEGTLQQAQFTSATDGTFYNGASGWNPSAINPLATHIPLIGGGKTASVQLMFVGTQRAYGRWVFARAKIDSVMVDPYRRG